MNKQITAIILAGGKSLRMGKDKGLLQLNGLTFVERIYRVVSKVCAEVIIVAKQDGYEYLGLPVFSDIYEDKGPAGGIHTGLFHSKSKFNIVVSCDMPFLSSDLLKFLLSYTGKNYDVIVPRHRGKLQPLCAVYSKNCFCQLELFIQQNQLKMMNIIEQLNTKYVDINSTLDFYSPYLFMNVNNQRDLVMIKKKLATKTQRHKEPQRCFLKKPL
ncbi:MAG: molybdenum cofactor guanylyltransferase [Bacteroidetes bacterium]|nr:molybdenum cofactor guanylyltransferase [Bacteroidota bacterium]